MKEIIFISLLVLNPVFSIVLTISNFLKIRTDKRKTYLNRITDRINEIETYTKGKANTKFGIFNTHTKQFEFDICEDTPMLAEARLFCLIGEKAMDSKYIALAMKIEQPLHRA